MPMHWFEKSIEEAVAISRQRKAIFVVFVEDSSEASARFAAQIDTQRVSAILRCHTFVAIKVQSDSNTHKQFVDIFKSTEVPSLNFVGKTGMLLDVIASTASADDLAIRIRNLIVSNGYVVSETSIFLPPSDGAVPTVPVAPQTLPVERNDSTTPTIPTMPVSRPIPVQSDDPPASTSSPITPAPNEVISEEDAKLRAHRQLRDEIKKKKLEDQAAKQRILDEIARDKEARKQQTNALPAPSTSDSTSNDVEKPTVSRQPAAGSNTARLQFKLPDGSSYTHEFSSASPLGDVVSYVHRELGDYMLSAYRRGVFTEAEHNRTLRELELVPNAVLLLLPVPSTRKAIVGAGSNLAGILWMIMAPVLSVWHWLRTSLFGANTVGTPPSPTTTTSGGRASSRQGAADVVPPDADRPMSNDRSQPKQRTVDGGRVIRRHGNIHRLTDQNDSDEDNNTWNGNSTQQM